MFYTIKNKSIRLRLTKPNLAVVLDTDRTY